MKIWIVDTFISQSFRGNPADICILIEDKETSATATFPSTQAIPAYPTKPLRPLADLLSIVQFLPNYTAISENCILMEFEVPDMILDLEPDLKLLSKLPYRALIVTARPSLDKFSEYDFILRYFTPRVGINEDPVCTSAHCRLTPYWAAKLAKNHLISYQASKRLGIIYSQNLGERVLISGNAVTVLERRTYQYLKLKGITKSN